MTKSKTNIRLGFSQQGDRTAADVVSFARWVFLGFVSRAEPLVLKTLGDVDPELDYGEVALTAWAHRWHLTDDWCLAYARSTVWKWKAVPAGLGRYWFDRDDEPAPRSGSRYGRQAPRPKKDPAHFELLARFQVCERTYAELAPKAGLSPEATRAAITALAKLLKLTKRKPIRRSSKKTGA